MGAGRLDLKTGEWSIFTHANTPMHEPWTYAVGIGDGLVYIGAWGAGVFGNEPNLIADCFAQPLLGDLAGAFIEVVFAILGGPGAANYDAFAKRFPTLDVH